jgi:AcrR family transcriptional regulator
VADRRTVLARRAAQRARLVSLASSVVADRGLAATTLRDVADLAGVTVPALYSHFTDRRDLLRAVVQDASVRLRREVLAPPTHAPDALGELVEYVRRWGAVDADHVRVVYWAVLEAAADEDVRGVLDAEVAPLRDFYRSIVLRGRRDGSIRRDLTADETVDLVMAAVAGVDIYTTRGVLPTARRRLTDVLAGVVIDALRARD